jgi:hypothetical protein
MGWKKLLLLEVETIFAIEIAKRPDRLGHDMECPQFWDVASIVKGGRHRAGIRSQEYWSDGVLEYWSIGVLEYWRVGVLEGWSERHWLCYTLAVTRPLLESNVA